MSFSEEYRVNESGEPMVYSKEVDNYLIKEYGFKYDDSCFSYGYGLQRVIKQDELYYMWINLTHDSIYLYQEYNCGGKTWDMNIDLEEKDKTIEKILEILDNYM